MTEAKPRDIYNRFTAYEHAVKQLKDDKEITPHNKELVLSWLLEKEDKLKSKRGREYQDKVRWIKTLDKLIRAARSVAVWVGDKQLDELTPRDLKKIYDDLEEGRITRKNGKPYARATRMDFYNRIFKSDFGKFMGWKEDAQEIMTLEKRDDAPVKFFRKPALDKLLTATHSLKYRALYAVLYDTGLRIGEALNIRKSDIQKQYDKVKKQDYYRVTIRAANTKSKRDRHISLWMDEANEILEAYLSSSQDDLLFPMGYAAIKKHLSVTARALGLTTEPDKKNLSLHDFRRSSATYWLERGLRIDSIKARLGHKPSSVVIDKYVSYLGLDDEMMVKEVRVSSYRDLEEQNRKLQEDVRIMREEQAKDYQRMRRIEAMLKVLADSNDIDTLQRAAKIKKDID